MSVVKNSKKRTKKSLTIPIPGKTEKRRPGYYSLIITKDGKTYYDNRELSEEKYCKVYFRKLEENISKHPEYTSQQILDAYKKLWSKFEFDTKYIDSWGHVWKNTYVADKRMLNYIDKIKNK